MEKICCMGICKKCATVQVVFGILFLVAALWKTAPAWFNAWTLVGVYLLLWGLSSFSGKH